VRDIRHSILDAQELIAGLREPNAGDVRQLSGGRLGGGKLRHGDGSKWGGMMNQEPRDHNLTPKATRHDTRRALGEKDSPGLSSEDNLPDPRRKHNPEAEHVAASIFAKVSNAKSRSRRAFRPDKGSKYIPLPATGDKRS
jgi:hypothetical protein